jgi:hypothetical protein
VNEAGTFTYIDEIKMMYNMEGVKSFYKGFVPTMMKSVPSWGIYFYTFEFMKRKLRSLFPETSSKELLNV